MFNECAPSADCTLSQSIVLFAFPMASYAANSADSGGQTHGAYHDFFTHLNIFNIYRGIFCRSVDNRDGGVCSCRDRGESENRC